MNKSIDATPSISLAMSGGGIRAMIFHLGVLRYLAEKNLLEKISHISTVSGGSLIVGLIFQMNNLTWPTSNEFIKVIYPCLEKKLCDRSLIFSMLRQLKNPINWRFIFSKANLLSKALVQEWEVTAKLEDLKDHPIWSINGTTAENGKRFRFKNNSIGDYMLGYSLPNKFPLANALAVSAAFPGLIGPLVMKTKNFAWKKRARWGDDETESQTIRLPYKKLHLYDGGIYDNLALEPLFDSGRMHAKKSGEIIIVSDASAPLSDSFSPFSVNPWRFKKIIDILSEQARSLRVRTFSEYLKQQAGRGAYIYIGMPISNSSECEMAKFSSKFPTSLRKVTNQEFSKLANHGYQVTKKVESLYGLISEQAKQDR